MTNDSYYPFYTDVITNDFKVQTQHQEQQQNIQKHRQHKDLLDLLAYTDDRSHAFSSTLSVTSHSVLDDDFNRLKYLIRTVFWPIDHQIRRQLWMNILTLNRVKWVKQRRQVSQTGQSTTSMIIDNSLNFPVLNENQWPTFVDTTNLCFYYLNESTGRQLLQRILSTFAVHHPDVTYCPTLEPLAALILQYHNEYEVLYLLNRLLIKNWLCGETRVQWEAHCNVFKKLLKLYYKSAMEIIDVRYTNTKEFYQEWFWWIFRYLPFSYLVKIMDCFFLEGPKLLFRISLTLVHLYTKRIKHESNGNQQTIADFCREISIPIDRLLRIAFQIRNFKRRTIEQLIEHEEKLLRNSHNHVPISNTTVSNQQSSLVTSQHLTHIPKSSILNPQHFLILWNWLPVRLSISQPMIVFTTEEHGFRLQTLLNKVDELEHSILIIKSTNGEIFGAFCAGLWSDRHNRTYFGFGESFLFTLSPKQIKYPWVGQQPGETTRQNQAKRELFLFVSNEKLIIGGGNGDGLCIDQSLCEGFTAHCDTFDNEPLSSQSEFSIAVLEMIAFDFSAS